MATPSDKLSESLEMLHGLQNANGAAAIRARDLALTHRDRLLKHGFLQEVIKGWYSYTSIRTWSVMGAWGASFMNIMMAAGGYPWTVIPLSARNIYMAALERASVGEDIAPFAEFLAGLVRKGLAGEPLPPVPKA